MQKKGAFLLQELLRASLDGLPPTLNHSHTNAGGRRFRSRECLDYQEYVVGQIKRQRGCEWPFSGRVSLSVVFTAINHIRWDIDNRIKVLQDCLTLGGVICDDSQIDELHVRRIYGLGQVAQTEIILTSL